MTSQPARRSAYSMGSLPNMLRSLLVIALFVAVLVAIVPRMSSVQRPEVDAAAKAGQIAAQTGWRVELPVGLGDGWVPTVASMGPGSGGVQTFTTVWQAPGGDLALKQVSAPSAEWVTRTIGDATVDGSVTVGSRTWERYAADGGGQTTFLLRPAGPGLTLAVTTSTPDAEARQFMGALKVVAPTR